LSENYIKKNLNKYLIIRTNFFGKGNNFKKSFSDKIINSLKKNKKISLFEDVYYNPISMHVLSDIIFKLIKIKKYGLYNVATNDKINKYEFGVKIANFLKLNSKLISKIKIDQMKLVLRPKSMYLKNNKIKKIINFNSSIDSNIRYI
jgi:dTDP-4-dehydrorhamnose reductase